MNESRDRPSNTGESDAGSTVDGHSAAGRIPVELLAEEFLELSRAGKRVSVEDYAIKYPELAEEIRELFPTIATLEQAKERQQEEVAPRFEHPSKLGEYEIVREIGRGGMGIVYEARQGSLNRSVAVKLLPQRTFFSTTKLERFRREARTAAGLQHPRIVPIYAVGEEEGVHYLVMQLIEGCGLDELLQLVDQRSRADVLSLRLSDSSLSYGGDETIAATPLSGSLAEGLMQDDFSAVSRALDNASPISQPRTVADEAPTALYSNADRDEASEEQPSLVGCVERAKAAKLERQLGEDYFRAVARIGRQAAEALSYAHARGTLHRDIKPANLLLDREGNCWITDFGLAKAIENDDVSRTGELCGTLRYMAPEQLLGNASPQTDLYSLGLTLYELATFQSPFAAPAPSQVIQKINYHRPPAPRQINPAVPADLERIIVTAMAHDAQDRYDCCASMASDLDSFLRDAPVLAKGTSPWTNGLRWAKRNRLVASLSAVVAILGATSVFGIAAFLAAPPRQPPPALPPNSPGAFDDGPPAEQLLPEYRGGVLPDGPPRRPPGDWHPGKRGPDGRLIPPERRPRPVGEEGHLPPRRHGPQEFSPRARRPREAGRGSDREFGGPRRGRPPVEGRRPPPRFDQPADAEGDPAND